MDTSKHIHRKGRGRLATAAVGTAAVLALAACSKTTTAGTGSTASTTPTASVPPSASAPAPSPSAAAAGPTISTASIAKVGTVLVNDKGQTLYELSSEQGGKITCTDANGCTAVWPDTELPDGVTAAVAGTGVQAGLLGTVKSADGKLYVTYNSFPVYTYAGDKATGTAGGQGIRSFGGTWTAITPAGAPARLTAATTAPATSAPAVTPSPTPKPSPSASTSGYGY